MPSKVSNSVSFSNWTDTFFNPRLSASTLTSDVVKGGGVALATAGFMQLDGAFLIICCGLSFSGDLLSLLRAGDLLLPKISLHLGTTLSRASSACQQPLLLTSSCSCQLSSMTCCFLSSSRVVCKLFILLSIPFAYWGETDTSEVGDEMIGHG